MRAKKDTVSRTELRIMEQHLVDLRAGKNPDIEEILKAHPKLAKRLRPTLEGARLLFEEFAWLRRTYPKSEVDAMIAKFLK